MTLLGWLEDMQGILALAMCSMGYAQRVFSVIPVSS